MLVKCQYCSKDKILKAKRSIKLASQSLIYTCPPCKQRIAMRRQLKKLPIRWDITLEKYGHTFETLPQRGKIVIECANCSKELTITYRGISILKSQIGNATHKKCFEHKPDVVKKSIEKSKEYWSDPRSKEIASEIIAGLWRDPNYRKSVVDALMMNEDSFVSWDFDKRSQFSKSLWSDKDYRKKMLKFLKTTQRQLMIELWADDDYRERLAKTAFWNPQPSKLQRKLIPIFDKHNISWMEEYRIRFYHFDYYLNDHAILIEVQGNYWHSKPEAEVRDRRKRTYVENNTDLTLVEIWEDEFKDRPKLEKKILKYVKTSISDK